MPAPQTDRADSVRTGAGRALTCPDLDEKAEQIRKLRAERAAGRLDTAAPHRVVPVETPGRPDRPALVHPRELAARPVGTPAGRVALVHAVAHIEANAVNLALDAVHRFDDLPDAYHDDWLRVAAEEAEHFAMLRDRLGELGAGYGDLPAHDGLWAMAVRTADDPLRRMALVPRVLEARGLDVTPGMIARLRQAGDESTARLLEHILADEVGHVAVGTRWFRWICAERKIDPTATFRSLLAEAGVRLAPPLNDDARRAAGFLPEELTVDPAVGPDAPVGQT